MDLQNKTEIIHTEWLRQGNYRVIKKTLWIERPSSMALTGTTGIWSHALSMPKHINRFNIIAIDVLDIPDTIINGPSRPKHWQGTITNKLCQVDGIKQQVRLFNTSEYMKQPEW